MRAVAIFVVQPDGSAAAPEPWDGFVSIRLPAGAARTAIARTWVRPAAPVRAMSACLLRVPNARPARMEPALVVKMPATAAVAVPIASASNAATQRRAVPIITASNTSVSPANRTGRSPAANHPARTLEEGSTAAAMPAPRTRTARDARSVATVPASPVNP
jgi:hypothetical protein